MRIAFTLLSSTFGMHQYTADLTDSAVRAGHDVHLVTTDRYVADRYGTDVRVHTPLSTEGTGFNRAGLQLPQLAATLRTITELRPDVVHMTRVHLWNPLLLWRLRRNGLPTVHSLHDLDPHPGVRHGKLIRAWHQLVVREADHLLVHGERYRLHLLDGSLDEADVTMMPLLHLFGGHATAQQLECSPPKPRYEEWALFFGRLEAYKGLPCLLSAARHISANRPGRVLVVAGPGDFGKIWDASVPEGVEIRRRHIEDGEAVDLFRRCGVVALPYTGATQSALVAAAYAFSKPVIVSDSGALPEYVVPGETGWVTPAGDTLALAQCLEEALSDPARLATMGQAGRRWYVDQRRSAEAALTAMYQHVSDRSRIAH